jgi:hypothetical protein
MSAAALLTLLIRLAGLGQLLLIVASLAIPRVLRWQEQTASWRPLIRQVFWTYAIYIWSTNLAFGLLSALAPGWLLDRSGLAGAVSGFITVYWGGRLLIQFVYFDRSDAPGGPAVRLAEVGLIGLFVALTLVYGAATLFNLGVIAP